MNELREIAAISSDREKILRDIEGGFLRSASVMKSLIDDLKPKNKTKGFKNKKAEFFAKNCNLEAFRRNVLPMLESMSDSDESFKKIGEVLQALYANLFCREFEKSEDFIENDAHVSAFADGGDFEYFSRIYEKGIAREAILYAADFLQPKNKGDFDSVKGKTREEIESMFAFTKDLTSKQRALIAKAASKMYSKNLESYLERLPRALNYFIEHGKPEFFDYYLKIGTVFRNLKNMDEDFVFPFHDFEKVFKEFEALEECGELKGLVLDYTVGFILRSGEQFTFFKNVSECKPDKARIVYNIDGVSKRYPQSSVPLIIDVIREHVGDEDKLREALEFPSKYPKIKRQLQEVVIAFFTGKLHLDTDFALVVDIVEETHSYIYDPAFFARFFGSVQSLPKENRDKFWKIAKRVVKQLRDASLDLTNFHCYSQGLKDLYSSDFDSFEEAIEEAMNFTYQFAASLGFIGELPEAVLRLYLMYWGDPKFEPFLEGLKLILARANDFHDKTKCKTDREKKNRFTNIKLAFFLYMKETFIFDEKGRLTSKSTPINPAVDLIEMAQGYSFYAFDTGDGQNPDKEKFQEETKLLDSLTTKREFLEKFFFESAGLAHEQRDSILRVSDLTEEAKYSDDGAKVEELRSAVSEMVSANSEVEDKSVKSLMERIRTEALAICEVKDWRGIMGFTGKGMFSYQEEGISQDSWIYRANQSTQLAASSGALFLGMGFPVFSEDLPELQIPEGIIEALPFEEEFAAFSRGEIGMREVLESVRKKNLEGKLRQNIMRALPFVARAIQGERLKSPGLMSVGTKIESNKSLSNEDFRFILELAGFGDIRNTFFHLKHAGKSLVNPPSPSALEQKLLIYLFMMFGTVDPAKIDMQVTIGGRLKNDYAGVVCASSILASDVSVQYADKAFSAGKYDVETDMRIMVYDAGVRKKSLPFDVAGANGRTDKIGCRSLVDIKQLQLLGTFGVHKQFEGPFAGQFDVYKSEFEELLKEHGLLGKLRESAWVSGTYSKNDAPEYHEKMVRNFTEARRDNEMLVAQTRVLMARRLQAYLRDNRDKIIAENPDEYERLKTY